MGSRLTMRFLFPGYASHAFDTLILIPSRPTFLYRALRIIQSTRRYDATVLRVAMTIEISFTISPSALERMILPRHFEVASI